MKMGEVGEGDSKSRGGGEWEFKDGRRCEVCNDKRSRAQVRIRGRKNGKEQGQCGETQ